MTTTVESLRRFGPTRERDADGKPGHYYVSVIRPGRGYALALGPFTARGPYGDRTAHLRALGYVDAVRRYVNEHGSTREQMELGFGTCRIPLESDPPAGRLNAALLPGRS